MKKQLNVRISDLTRKQLDKFAEVTHLSEAEVFMLAIDRLYREEFKVDAIDDLIQHFGESTPVEYVGDIWGNITVKTTLFMLKCDLENIGYTSNGMSVIYGGIPGDIILRDNSGSAVLKLA